MGVCRRYHSRRDRPALASDDHWTLTVFSTYSNFNLVDIRMFGGFRRHAIHNNRIRLLDLFSAAGFNLLTELARHTLGSAETLGLMSEAAPALRTGKCMSTSVALIADTLKLHTQRITHGRDALFLLHWSH